MTKQALISISKLVFVILAFANTACEMKIASDNQINGNQLLSNNLSGNGSPGMQNFRPANAAGGNDMRPNNIPILPASIEAEQARARNVINTMAVENNPFAEVIAATNAPG